MRASAMIPSQIIGLRLWGMVLDPTLPRTYGSSSSATSDFCNRMTSWAILLMVIEIMASSETYSAKPSRAGCQQISGTPSPSSAISSRWISSPCSPTEASVPAAPANWPTSTRGAACSRRSMWRRTSASQIATLKPNVMGNACWPWVRPGMIVSRSRRASSASASARRAQIAQEDGVGGLDLQNQPGVGHVLGGRAPVDVAAGVARRRATPVARSAAPARGSCRRCPGAARPGRCSRRAPGG